MPNENLLELIEALIVIKLHARDDWHAQSTTQG